LVAIIGGQMKKVVDMIDSRTKVSGVSKLQLTRTEKELGALFPDEYKELFIETNGATFGDWVLFSLPSDEQLGFSYDIVQQNALKRPEHLPNDMICIGENAGGDKLCYRVRKRFMQEQVYVWYAKTAKLDCKSLNLFTFIDWHVPKINTNKPKMLGNFTVTSGKLIISDPAYMPNEEAELQIILTNVKNGKWTAAVSYTPAAVVKHLTIYYGEKKPTGKWALCDKLIGIDSAQGGVFDYAALNSNQVNYLDDVDISNEQGVVVSNGAISKSGYGDGMYEVKVKYNRLKEIVGVMIVFEDEE
jgi:SMI1-KNR4 cell-wall